MNDLLGQLRATTPAEWLALLLGIGYALLAVRHSRWAWVSGAGSSALLAWLAARRRLPMQAIMQTIYVGFAVYGFRRWTVGESPRRLPTIGTLRPAAHVLAMLLIALAALLLAPLLASSTGAAWPRLDMAIMLGSFFATWLTSESRLENWGYWIVINLSSMFLYGAQGLMLVVLLYAIYLLIAIVGLVSWWRRWHRSGP